MKKDEWQYNDLIKSGPTPIELLRLLMDFTKEVPDYECVVDTFKELTMLRARVAVLSAPSLEQDYRP